MANEIKNKKDLVGATGKLMDFSKIGGATYNKVLNRIKDDKTN